MRRFLFLLFLAAAFGPGIAAAQPMPPADSPPAYAGAAPFTVSGVKVDASGASASEAFNIAVDSGRRRAWATLVHRLTRQEDWERIPEIDADTLRKMITGYQVSDERRSTTRYTADVTYTFNGDLVRRFLRGADIAYSVSAAPPLLIVPLAPDYSATSAWTEAWAANRMAAGDVPLQVPKGDALDVTMLGPISFGTGAWSDVQPAASRVHAAQAALVLAGPIANGQMTVSVRILSPAAPQMLSPVRVAVNPGEGQQQIYAEAVQLAGQAIGEAWKARSTIDFNERATLTAEIRLDSLAQWGMIRQRLATVPVVTHVNVAAMNIGHARLELSYAGTPAQLRNFLSQASLALTNRDGVWWLSTQSPDGGMVDQ